LNPAFGIRHWGIDSSFVIGHPLPWQMLQLFVVVLVVVGAACGCKALSSFSIWALPG
jgi:hypothetical protein